MDGRKAKKSTFEMYADVTEKSPLMSFLTLERAKAGYVSRTG